MESRKFILLICAFVLLAPEICHGQPKYLKTQDGYLYSLTKVPPDFTRTKTIDSLINFKAKISLLKIHTHGDPDLHVDYQRIYDKDGKWQYMTNWSSNFLPDLNELNKTSLMDSTAFKKHSVYIGVGQQNSSLFQEYDYLLIKDGEIILSLISSIPLDEIKYEEIRKNMNIFNVFTKK